MRGDRESRVPSLAGRAAARQALTSLSDRHRARAWGTCLSHTTTPPTPSSPLHPFHTRCVVSLSVGVPCAPFNLTDLDHTPLSLVSTRVRVLIAGPARAGFPFGCGRQLGNSRFGAIGTQATPREHATTRRSRRPPIAEDDDDLSRLRDSTDALHTPNNNRGQSTITSLSRMPARLAVLQL